MSCAVAYWHETGRLEARGAFPRIPNLTERGKADKVGLLYENMRQRREIKTYPGRATDVMAFISDVAEWLRGETVVCALDRYRRAEAQDAFAKAGVRWKLIWRGVGAGHVADGSADVRAFQKLVLEDKVKVKRNLMLESAIASSRLRRDASGNPALDKKHAAGRIDALQAAVLALGLGYARMHKPEREFSLMLSDSQWGD